MRMTDGAWANFKTPSPLDEIRDGGNDVSHRTAQLEEPVTREALAAEPDAVVVNLRPGLAAFPAGPARATLAP